MNLQTERLILREMEPADNLPSIKVAEGIGMTKEDEFVTRYFNGDMLHYLFAVRKHI